MAKKVGRKPVAQKKKNQPLSASVPPEVAAAVAKRAAATGERVSHIVTEALRSYLRL